MGLPTGPELESLEMKRRIRDLTAERDTLSHYKAAFLVMKEERDEVVKDRLFAEGERDAALYDVRVLQGHLDTERAHNKDIGRERDQALLALKAVARNMMSGDFDPNYVRKVYSWCKEAAHPGLPWPGDFPIFKREKKEAAK